MSIFAHAAHSFARAPENRRGRRTLLAGLLGCLTIPRLAPASPRPAGGPGRPTTLDPSHPAAIRLDRLHRALLDSHGPVFAAHRALEDRLDELWEDETPTAKGEHDATLDGLHDELGDRQKDRRSAYFALLHAVVEAAGGPDLDEARWLAFGVPLHTVRVGSRVYAVSSDHDAEFDPGTGAYGLGSVNVVDL